MCIMLPEVITASSEALISWHGILLAVLHERLGWPVAALLLGILSQKEGNQSSPSKIYIL